MNQPIVFQNFFDEEVQISQQQIQFQIGDTAYTIIFAAGQSLTASFVAQIEDETPANYHSFSVKFVATQRIDEFNETGNSDNLYTSPNHFPFSYREIKQFHQTLIQIMLTHQREFQAQCYYFIVETQSLRKTYERLCTQYEKNLIKFRKIVKENCFIIVFNEATEA
ncbi:hypothetical protein QEO94_02250 [Kingella negevensis]|uniref:hypothetical protein n=1 Tax=Kingella negevensis TaxID=1522312 RepID=UPI00254311FA|nr:hypothetical protein [Kingella negevensis]WII93681.1 hypothetical protein QEO94_02250 [Kingella negevensis]